jgi:hypothetical protein
LTKILPDSDNPANRYFSSSVSKFNGISKTWDLTGILSASIYHANYQTGISQVIGFRS